MFATLKAQANIRHCCYLNLFLSISLEIFFGDSLHSSLLFAQNGEEGISNWKSRRRGQSSLANYALHLTSMN
jgi:hypothetical protein